MESPDSCVPGFKQRVFWISGGPGVGKTAISAVLSSRYLAACHFCASVGWTFLSVPVLTGLESPSYGNAQFRAAASQDASGAEVKRARESCRTPQRRVFETPHMDALARRGTTFLNAHIQSPLCNPSRTSLMLGLRPTTTGIVVVFDIIKPLGGGCVPLTSTRCNGRVSFAPLIPLSIGKEITVRCPLSLGGRGGRKCASYFFADA